MTDWAQLMPIKAIWDHFKPLLCIHRKKYFLDKKPSLGTVWVHLSIGKCGKIEAQLRVQLARCKLSHSDDFGAGPTPERHYHATVERSKQFRRFFMMDSSCHFPLSCMNSSSRSAWTKGSSLSSTMAIFSMMLLLPGRKAPAKNELVHISCILIGKHCKKWWKIGDVQKTTQ